MQDKPKVLIAIPNTGSIQKNLVFTAYKLMADKRIKPNLILPSHSPTVENRHRIAKDFLKDGYDFLISIDSDNPPKRNIIDLIFLNLDVVGCPTPVWCNKVKGDYPIYWNAMDACPDGYKVHNPKPIQQGGLEEVDAVGTGCIIIARRVLEALDGKFPFEDEWDENGFRLRGHDFLFCSKVKEAGFKIYAHFAYPCMHFNMLELTEVIEAFIDCQSLSREDNEFTRLRDSLKYDNFSIDKVDFDTIRKFLQAARPKRILEYGPGVTTSLLKMFGEVHSIEEDPERKFDTVVAKPEGKYDLVLIDGPRGTPTLSREKSVIEAKEHTDCIIMHDTYRNGERETIKKHFSDWMSSDMGSKRGMHLFRRYTLIQPG